MPFHPIIGAPPNASSLAFWVDGRDLDGVGNSTLTPSGAITSIVNKGTRGGTLTKIGGGATPASYDSANLGCVKFDGTGGMHTSSGAVLTPPIVIAQVMFFATLPNAYGLDGVDGTNSVAIVWSTAQVAMADKGALSVSLGTPTPTNVWSFANAKTTGTTGSTLYVNNSTAATGTMTGTGMAGLSIGAHNANAAPCPANTRCAQALVWSGGTLPTAEEVLTFISSIYGPGWLSRTALDHVGFGAISATPALAVVGGNKFVMIGDSLTQGGHGQPWYTPAVTTINGAVTTPCTFVNKGVSGEKVADFVARVNTDVIAQSPQIVVIEGGINDTSLQGTPLNTFITSCNTLITNIQAGLPGVKIAWVLPLCVGEQIPDPAWSRIAPYCQAIAQVCAQKGVTLIPTRDMQQAYDRTNNTPLPGNFQSPGPSSQVLLTHDGVHPSLATNGDAQMSSTFTARCTFSG